MFQPDPSLSHVAAAREQVVAVIEAINQPQVQIPGKTAQQCHGYLCGVRNANGTFSIYVGLYLPRASENVVYVHERRQLGVEEYRQVEIEGLQFLESMGFMLDNLNYRNLAPAAQDQALRRIPLFSAQRPSAPAPAPEPSGSDPARLARLLASF